ncbi:tRNA-guanine transglycosylase DpdA [Methanocalculus sp.]|uniref:tRNA-guanine transglycosylase DpdA n=1 Tax=Methanocalculus sp. TaxID=2004547 RepID=UPI00260AC656|nr:tRNA-guanine transglycosylase DpdA [Methanocalculus sp.]MDG6250792.1 tRNA-guanine transglycosylase DpdA [Methanocalculus sp.]
MRYYIPEWDDRVDPKYDFLTDTHSGEHNAGPLENDAYMWDLFGIDKVPFDGLLVSIATLQNKTTKYAIIEEKGIHGFFGLPKEFPIMADCGAFSYIEQEQPPYKTKDVLKTYSNLDFNYGVSVDHLVVTQFADQKDDRMRITYQNGIAAFEEWSKHYKKDFQLIVAIQGEDIADYLRMYNKFLNRGITHLAFGGLVRTQTRPIADLIDHLINEISTSPIKPEYLHFFGLARSSLFSRFRELEELGVQVAFDSSSYLRKAWLASAESQCNYITKEQEGYTAIRIPPRLSKQMKGSLDQEVLERLGRSCLTTLRKYDQGEIGINATLAELSRFMEATQQPPKFLEYYRRTLADKPWKHCSCPICSEHGIEVVIFRGNNRNRRRGFHNLLSFHTLMHDELKWGTIPELEENGSKIVFNEISSLEEFEGAPRTLVITACTKKKAPIDPLMTVPAKDLYQGTIFKKVQEYCNGKGFDYVIISARFGLLLPDDEVWLYEKFLKTKQDIEEIRPRVENKLAEILPNYDRVLVIAGKNYREVLRNVIDDRFVFVKSKGIGDLISIVSDAIPIKDRTLEEFC